MLSVDLITRYFVTFLFFCFLLLVNFHEPQHNNRNSVAHTNSFY